MEHCLASGLARNIGVSNFAVPHLESILEVATTKPSVCQIELHPYLQQSTLLNFLRKNSIIPVGYGTLAPLTKAPEGPANEICGRIAREHGTTDAAVLLKWVLAMGGGAVTTSSKKERMQEYLFEVSELKLTNEDVGMVSSACAGFHFRAFFVDQMKPYEEAR